MRRFDSALAFDRRDVVAWAEPGVSLSGFLLQSVALYAMTHEHGSGRGKRLRIGARRLILEAEPMVILVPVATKSRWKRGKPS